MCNSVTALLGSISKPVYKLRSKPTGASNPVCVHTGGRKSDFSWINRPPCWDPFLLMTFARTSKQKYTSVLMMVSFVHMLLIYIYKPILGKFPL